MCGEGSDFRSNSFKDQGLGEVDIRDYQSQYRI